MANVDPTGISHEVRTEIRREAVQQTAKWAIGATLALMGFAVAGWWLYLKPYMIDVVGGVPRGAVIAFDRDDLDVNKCPPNWSPFELTRGRVVVGAGQGDKLSYRSFRKVDGQEEYLLTKDNFPIHRHDTIIGVVSSPGNGRPKEQCCYWNYGRSGGYWFDQSLWSR